LTRTGPRTGWAREVKGSRAREVKGSRAREVKGSRAVAGLLCRSAAQPSLEESEETWGAGGELL